MSNFRKKSGLVIIMALGLFLFYTGYTDADLTAERSVVRNIMRVMTLNFFSQNTANSTSLIDGFRTTGFQPNGFDVHSFRVRRDGDKNLRYLIKAKWLSGNEDLYKGLKVDILDSQYTNKFSGKLSDLSLSSIINNTDSEDWIIILKLEEVAEQFKNKACEFDIEITTWELSPSEDIKGIYASRKINNLISTGSWE